MKITEKILLKFWFIKKEKSIKISETFIKYIVEDIQDLVKAEFGKKPDNNYELFLLKKFNRIFEKSIKFDAIEIEINKDRTTETTWFNFSN